MKKRKLAAVMACRANSTRLYAKPLQNLKLDYCVLDQKVDTFAALGEVVSEVVIAISEGTDNLAYQSFAERRQLPYLFGSRSDILSRLINGGLYVGATDVLRVTSDNPFIWWEKLSEAWERHIEEDNDLTVTDGCPYGSYFEIIRLESLITAHSNANDYQKEACTQYFRDHSKDFKTRVITPPSALQRLDVRLTVDYPEDLVVCRRIFEQFQQLAPLIPLQAIIEFWDQQPLFSELLGPYISGHGIWVHNEGCPWAPSNN